MLVLGGGRHLRLSIVLERDAAVRRLVRRRPEGVLVGRGRPDVAVALLVLEAGVDDEAKEESSQRYPTNPAERDQGPCARAERVGGWRRAIKRQGGMSKSTRSVNDSPTDAPRSAKRTLPQRERNPERLSVLPAAKATAKTGAQVECQ